MIYAIIVHYAGAAEVARGIYSDEVEAFHEAYKLRNMMPDEEKSKCSIMIYGWDDKPKEGESLRDAFRRIKDKPFQKWNIIKTMGGGLSE